MTGQGPLAPGVVQVRLNGDQDDAAAMAGVLAAVPGLEILTGPDGPYPNRRQPGHRLYLTLRLTPPITNVPAARMEGTQMSDTTCPECGEPAVHRPPDDLVPYQAHGTPPPQWSHTDNSALCPVMTPAGYQPAVPADPENTPIPYTLTPQAEVAEEARAMAAQDAELDARQMDAQHQEALAENAACEAEAEAPNPRWGRDHYVYRLR